MSEKTDWNDYSHDERKLVENTVLLVGVLFEMCKVKLVIEKSGASEINEVNTPDNAKAARQSTVVLENL